MLVQVRTGRIGLVSFLNKAQVLGVDSPSYRCKQGIETAKYLLLYYLIEQEYRE